MKAALKRPINDTNPPLFCVGRSNREWMHPKPFRPVLKKPPDGRPGPVSGRTARPSPVSGRTASGFLRPARHAILKFMFEEYNAIC